VTAICGAESREAEILPIAIGIVIEPDAWISRSPRPIRPESSSGGSIICSLHNLHAIPIESDYGWIRAGGGGFHNVASFDVNRTFPRLEVPIAAIGTIPTGNVAILIVRHHAAIGFISRDVMKGNRRSQPQFYFMAASAGWCLIDLDCSRYCLCGPPLAQKDGSRITKIRRLTDAVSQAGGGLHIPPETSSPPDSSSRPEACECRSRAASAHPVTALADRILREWKGGAEGVTHACRTSRASTVDAASPLVASAKRNRNTDHEDGLQAVCDALLLSHSAKLNHQEIWRRSGNA
jgi:hypothetical protein